MVLYFSILSKYGQLSTAFVSNLLVPVKPNPELKHGMRLNGRTTGIQRSCTFFAKIKVNPRDP